MSLARHISVLSPELNASLQRGLRNSIEKKVRLRSRKRWDVVSKVPHFPDWHFLLLPSHSLEK